MYDNGKYSAGILARFISKQDRYDIGAGGIVMNGVDKGETPGASIFSINGGYKYNKNVYHFYYRLITYLIKHIWNT